MPGGRTEKKLELILGNPATGEFLISDAHKIKFALSGVNKQDKRFQG